MATGKQDQQSSLPRARRTPAFRIGIGERHEAGGESRKGEPLKPSTIRLIGRLHAWLSKLAGGRLEKALGRAPFMMLTTKGRKTGQPRTTPVLYLEDGPDLIVVASFGGNDMNPAWYLNLLDRPEAEILIHGERRRVVARKVSAEEKAVIWPRLVRMYPNFNTYRQRTNREIPLLRLSSVTQRRGESHSG